MVPEDEFDGMSKRERQKARRRARLEIEAAQSRRARRRRLALRGLAALIAVGLVGLPVGNWVNERRQEAAAKATALARLDELGCTELETLDDGGAGHIQDLGKADPSLIYPERPAASGRHTSAMIKNGVYDKVIDERPMVHNLEHGFVNIYYRPDAPEGEIEELKKWARERISGPNPKMIVAAAEGEWVEEKNFAFVAWRARQLCDEFDPGIALTVLDDHYSAAGIAPEKTAPAVMGDELDPEEVEGPLLFPPLSTDPVSEAGLGGR